MRLNRLIATAALAASCLPLRADILPPELLQSADPEASYLFYLHAENVDLAQHGAEDSHGAVTEALAEMGFVVATEVRPKTAVRNFPNDHQLYARHVAKSVYRLIDRGVPAQQITVAGYARGGLIAMMSAAMLNHPRVNFVLMASCPSDNGRHADKRDFLHQRVAPKLRGRFLSLVDDGDPDFQSCQSLFERSERVEQADEVSIYTRQDHAAFLEPRNAWLEPLQAWSGL